MACCLFKTHCLLLWLFLYTDRKSNLVSELENCATNFTGESLGTDTVPPILNLPDCTLSLKEFGNSLEREIMCAQLYFCPEVMFCTIVRSEESFKDGCYRYCNCDYFSSVKNRTCCQDITDPVNLQTIDEKQLSNNRQDSQKRNIFLPRRTCTSLILPESDSKDFASAFADCLDKLDENRANCTREYTSKIDMLVDIVPCISKSTCKVFRNRFCAY